MEENEILKYLKDIKSRIEDQDHNITVIKQEFLNFKQEFPELKKKLELMKEDITSNTTDVRRNEDKLSNLEDRMKKMEQTTEDYGSRYDTNSTRYDTNSTRYNTNSTQTSKIFPNARNETMVSQTYATVLKGASNIKATGNIANPEANIVHVNEELGKNKSDKMREKRIEIVRFAQNKIGLYPVTLDHVRKYSQNKYGTDIEWYNTEDNQEARIEAAKEYLKIEL